MAFLLLSFCSAEAQQKPTSLDKSPLDVSYCPPNYPILKMNSKVDPHPVARVLYSRPLKAGRPIFDGIVRFGEIWRVGANEATEIEFFRNIKFGNKTIHKGRYTLYAICQPETWTIIINSEKDAWGIYYNQKKDVARIDVPVQKSNEIVEPLTIYFEEAKSDYFLNIMWDDVKVAVPFKAH